MSETFMPLLSGVLSTFLENPIGQTVGFVAMFVGFFWYATSDDTKIVRIFIAANIFWLLHFIFISNIAAVGATVIAIVRLILSLKYKKSKKVLLWVVLVSISFGIISFDGKIISVLPLLATIVATYWFFFLEKLQLRILLFATSVMWLVYHLGTGSISGIINEIIAQITICISMYYFLFGTEKKVYLRERIRNVLRKRPPRPDFGRYIFLRDKDRFE